MELAVDGETLPDWRKTLNQTLTQRVGDALAEDTSRIVHRFSAVEEHHWAGWYFGTLRDLLAPAKPGLLPSLAPRRCLPASPP